MAITNPRGVQVSDVPASLMVAVTAASAHIVAVGVAPVHSLTGFTWTTPGSGVSPYVSVVNKPILSVIPSDFTTQLGLSSVFGPGVKPTVNTTGGAYGLAEVYNLCFVENNAGPLTCINVWDPWIKSLPVANNGLPVVNAIAQISGEVILPSLKIVGVQTSNIGVRDVDYSFTYNDTTLQTGYVTVFSTGNLSADTSVNATYYTPNIAAVTYSDIVGGTDVNGNYLGLEVIEKVFPVTQIVPATILTPGFSTNTAVIAAANAHAQGISNGRFRAIYISDISASSATQYTQIATQKASQNLQSAFELAGWPHTSLSGARYHASTQLAVMMQVTDAVYGGIPYVSPSNKAAVMDSTILSDGTPIIVDLAQADYIENLGVFTFVNNQGWRSQGDYTCAYPSDTDIQDFWINERRMFNWLGNTLSLTLAQYIDLAGNTTTLTSINETIQAFGNTLVQKGAANTFGCSFNPNENLASQVMAGIYTFHILWTPPTPIRTLNLLLQYDVAGLTAWISQVAISSSNLGGNSVAL